MRASLNDPKMETSTIPLPKRPVGPPWIHALMETLTTIGIVTGFVFFFVLPVDYHVVAYSKDFPQIRFLAYWTYVSPVLALVLLGLHSSRAKKLLILSVIAALALRYQWQVVADIPRLS
jgi:hypothetical protein